MVVSIKVLGQIKVLNMFDWRIKLNQDLRNVNYAVRVGIDRNQREEGLIN